MTPLNQTLLKMDSEDSEIKSRTAQLDRRDFLKVFGGGLLVCLAPHSAWSQESGRGWGGHELPKDLSAWLHIDANSNVKVFTGKVEVGQNIRTSLAQQVAEELRVPFDSVTMIMGDTDLVPWDMGTFGSRTTPTMGPQLRTMAAAARQMLIEMAAQRLHVDQASLACDNCKIIDPKTSRSISYGELTRGEKLVKTVTGEGHLTPPAEWKIAGTAVPKAEGRDFVTGKHKFPSDITRPGMMFGAADRLNDAFADASDDSFFGRPTDQALELRPDRDACSGLELNAVFANTVKSLPAFDRIGAVDDLRINAGFNCVEYVTAGQVNGGSRLPGQIDTGLMGGDNCRGCLGDVAAREVMGLEFLGGDLYVRLNQGDLLPHDHAVVDIAQLHPEQVEDAHLGAGQPALHE